MANWRANLVLEIDTFEAENKEEADKMIDTYVDLIARLLNRSPENSLLTWEACDWKVEENN